MRLLKRDTTINTLDLSLPIDPKVREIIIRIKTDEEWMKKIKIKAENNNLTLDEAVLKDALWIFELDRK